MKYTITLLVSVTMFLVGGCSNKGTVLIGNNVTLKASVAPVVVRDRPRAIEVRGMIHAENDAVLSSRAMGPVVREHVKIGDKVKKGQVLIEIEERMSGGGFAQAQGALAQTEAVFALAERNFHRYEHLLDKKACSELEFETARMQYEQSKGAVMQARGAADAAGSVADEASVRAPFDAVVVEKFVNLGDLVAPGRPIIHLQSAGGREVWFSVRSDECKYLKIGDTLPLVEDTQPELTAMIASISEIAPSADPITHMFSVKAIVEDDVLPAGITVRLSLAGEPREVISIPASAIYNSGSLTLVASIDKDGIARVKAVTLGQSFGNEIEVLSGLLAGEWVITGRNGVIAEGTRIERTNG
jgi:RND family efflux transporter MFP subunit